MAMSRQLILTGCLKSPCLLRVYPSAWNNLVAYKANQESVWHATEPDSGGSSVEPPALGACPNSRCSILSESDSSLSYEQVFSPLEYRSDTAAAAECAGLRAERPCLAVYR